MDTTDRSGISYWNEVRRKLIHLSSLWMPLAMCFLPRLWLCIAFGIMFLLNLLVEHAYASGVPWLMRLYDRFSAECCDINPNRGNGSSAGDLTFSLRHVFPWRCFQGKLRHAAWLSCCWETLPQL